MCNSKFQQMAPIYYYSATGIACLSETLSDSARGAHLEYRPLVACASFVRDSSRGYAGKLPAAILFAD
jgi:hypothetical protein